MLRLWRAETNGNGWYFDSNGGGISRLYDVAYNLTLRHTYLATYVGTNDTIFLPYTGGYNRAPFITGFFFFFALKYLSPFSFIDALKIGLLVPDGSGGSREHETREAKHFRKIYLLSSVKGDKMEDVGWLVRSRNICIPCLTQRQRCEGRCGWAEWTGDGGARVSENIYLSYPLSQQMPVATRPGRCCHVFGWSLRSSRSFPPFAFSLSLALSLAGSIPLYFPSSPSLLRRLLSLRETLFALFTTWSDIDPSSA